MGRLIAVDPGQWSGLAFFDNEELVEAAIVGKGIVGVLEYFREMSMCCFDGDTVLIEVPQVYQQRQWKGDPNDLISVAYIAGMWGAWFSQDMTKLKLIRPHLWKGSRPKDVDIDYTLQLLSPAETRVLPKLPKYKIHNVIDAIGIGLWSLGRR